MIIKDKKKRITLDKIKQHPWFKEEILEKEQLEEVLMYRHQEMELKRGVDETKQAVLQYSERVVRPLLPIFKQRIIDAGYKIDRKAPKLPENYRANMIRDVYTTIDGYETLQEIKLVIEDEMRGMIINHREINDVSQIFMSDDVSDKDDKSKETEKGVIDIDNFCFTATIAHLKDDGDDETMSMEIDGTKLNVQLYWDSEKNATLVQFNVIPKNSAIDKDKMDFFERKKLKNMWRRLKNAFITRAGHVLTGLPKKETNKDMEALYKKCFPPQKDNENKK
eukprot:CAMPEP_0201575508 /NCGR_PEP_ID=MMETSP0190_2-20130828/20737_1 /ASSEMBLY_ACC=CAM_ASM_000263 /TAXON_ID=37353 /ORGANISM="Rosalina sp." /LENGTH=278 /DNA_ID=CAMNT_0048005203 /DNA_START=167 /DNA_END=1000 /DNA_ORIENTATION=+